MRSDLWLATVALPSEQSLDHGSIAQTLSDEFGEGLSVSEGGSDNVIPLTLGDATAGITYVPQPMPLDEIAPMCGAAWYWPNAAAKMRQHRSHALVMLVDEESPPVEKARKLTRLSRAVLRSQPAIGLVWGPGRLIHAADAFVQESEKMPPDSLPLMLWIDFRVAPGDEGKLALFTTGLEALGRYEIEIPAYPGNDPQALRALAYNVAHYLFDGDDRIKDGDTIGMPDGTRLTARVEYSMLGDDQQVLQLEVAP